MKNRLPVFFALQTSVIAVIFLFTGCPEPESRVINWFTARDSQPPVLEKIVSETEQTVSLVFNEDVEVFSGFSDLTVDVSENIVSVTFPFVIVPGSSSVLKGTVADCVGNTLSFSVNIWGFNPDPAELVINEFTVKGTQTQPDRVELYVRNAGNIAGMVLYDGIPGNMRSKVIFPSLEVKEGDFLTVWFTQSLPDGVSGPFNICAGAETGLSENNGIITLASSPAPGSGILDCVIYSPLESTQYGGYGTKAVYVRVLEAFENEWWQGAPVNAADSTSTRSVSRVRGFCTHTADDWYITETGGFTFGSSNTSPQYSGKNGK